MVLETVSLVVTAVFAFIVVLRVGYLTVPRLRGAAKVGMWVVFGYFVLNVLGNLASASLAETLVFTPVAVLLALLALRLAIE